MNGHDKAPSCRPLNLSDGSRPNLNQKMRSEDPDEVQKQSRIAAVENTNVNYQADLTPHYTGQVNIHYK